MSSSIRNANGNRNANRDRAVNGNVNGIGNSGSSRLNSNANSFSPNQAYERRQSLRDASVQESANSIAQYGAIGSSSSRRPSNVSNNEGGVALTNGIPFVNGLHFTNGGPVQEAVYHDHALSSSTYPDHRGRSYSMPNNAATSTNLASSSSGSGLHALLASGPIIVSISAERESLIADPARPLFLHGINLPSVGEREWFTTVLPHVTMFTFEMASSTDLHYAASIFSASQLTGLYQAVTKITFPGFHWFSGVAYNRVNNPYFQMTSTLPALEEVTFTMHTAGITTSAFGERQMIALERTDPVRAKERVKMSLEETVRKWELNGLFCCLRLRRVRIEYIDCEMTAFFTRAGHPVDVLREVQIWLVDGFARKGLNVLVELVRVV